MKRIKEFLIHALGGVTLGEHIKAEECSYYIGKHRMARTLKSIIADHINGMNADEWCEHMYKAIESTARHK